MAPRAPNSRTVFQPNHKKKPQEERIIIMNNIPYKVYLQENELPKAWYNLRADMNNKPAPLLNPGTLQPIRAEELPYSVTN